MAVLEGPDFKISRGSMPPDPPRGSRLPAFGPLFTNFLQISSTPNFEHVKNFTRVDEGQSHLIVCCVRADEGY